MYKRFPKFTYQVCQVFLIFLYRISKSSTPVLSWAFPGKHLQGTYDWVMILKDLSRSYTSLQAFSVLPAAFWKWVSPHWSGTIFCIRKNTSQKRRSYYSLPNTYFVIKTNPKLHSQVSDGGLITDSWDSMHGSIAQPFQRLNHGAAHWSYLTLTQYLLVIQ